MLRTALFTLIALFSLIGCAQPAHAEPAAAAHYDYLLASSVRIFVLSNVDGEQHANAALGTLVTVSEQPAILTHGHWPSLRNDTLVEMRILTLEDQLLARISAQSLAATTIYADDGTLLIAAPSELLGRLRFAQIGRIDKVHPNTPLQIIYAFVTAAGEESFTMTTVTVELLSQHNGLPVMQFHGMDGQIIQPGNSGGAVYLNGQIVGNIWGTIATMDGSLTNSSIAATFMAPN